MQNPQVLASREWVQSGHGERLEELSGSLLEKWWQKHNDVPEHLYHYTSIDGLLGALCSQTLWATHALYLNDRTELVHAHELITKEVGTRIRNAHEAKDVISKNLLKRLQGAIDPRFGTLHYFLTCFCQADDRLSQWRAYSDRGGGYALGVAARVIRDHLTNGATDLALRQVIYDHDDQRALVGMMLDRTISLLAEETAGQTEETAMPTIATFASFLRDHLAEFHFSFKHESFQEEEEWRIIHMTPVAGPGEVDRVQFRAMSGHAIPYVELQLHATKGPLRGKLPIGEVVYGPTLNQDWTDRSLRWLLHKHGYPHAQVRRSLVPLSR